MDEDKGGQFKKVLDGDSLKIPKVGDIIKGTVVSASKREVCLDIDGITTGIVRGRGMYNESDEYNNLKPGDEVEATVMEMDNENGQLELSFRFAGQQKAWGELNQMKEEGKIIKAKILDANKGGLMIQVQSTKGFLPVSQLTPEHYPRVPGGDKTKILEKLKSYINEYFDVKIIDASEKDDKLIVSEKQAWEETQHSVISQYKVGDQVAGKITAITDFGVFIEFGDHLEGLIHISELAWQRIDDPKDFVNLGDAVKAEIINIDGSKIFLSMKKLVMDPWKKVSEKYQIGQIVEGKVLKVNPFGLFVELDRDIHGLAHVSQLSNKPVANVDEIAKSGDTMKFKIVSIEPNDHRLGLSLKDLKEEKKSEKKDKEEKEEKEEVEEVKEEKKAEKKKEKKKEEPKKEEEAVEEKPAE